MTAQASTTSTVTMTGGDVLDALAAIRPALSRKRSAFPWERCVHLTVDGAVARMECHTGEVSARVPFDAEGACDAGLDVWVDAQDLQRAVAAHATRRGTKARTVLEVGVDGDEVVIAAGAASSRVDVVDADEMLAAGVYTNTTLVVDRDRFVGDIAAAAVCAESGLYALPRLTGINVKDGKIACTDRYRLAYFDLAGTGELPEVTAPAALLTKMLKATTGDTLLVGVDQEWMTVRAANMVMTLHTIDDEYPSVAAIVPTGQDRPTLTLPREKMTDLLKPYAKGSNTITITPVDEDLLLEVYTGTGRDGGPAATATIPKTGSDTCEHTLAFNCRYLSEAIKSHTGQTVTIATSAPLKPTSITSDAPGRLTILQPVRMAG